jgi:UDP-GlcNAc:undecaprenyl-phosphate GlcNAc-1-phosphate transferase
MFSIFFLGGVSFLIAVSITPLIRHILIRWGILDIPDRSRKLHGRDVPRGGGVALAIAYSVSLAALLLLPVQAADMVRRHLDFAVALLPAAGVVFLTGLLDDIVSLRPGQKLVGQIIAGVLAYSAGVRMLGQADFFFGQEISLLLTVVWLIVCTNAFNLIDGVDGLTAGAGFLAAVAMLVAAILSGNAALSVVTAPLAGALLGILAYNSSPASIFMGDCGSLTVGFLLGCFGILWSQKATTMLGMAAPTIALGLPLIDMGLAVVRRFLRLRPISAADRAHIHHRLLDQGLTPKRVTLLLYGVSGVAAALSLLASVVQGRLASLVVLVFCVCAWWGVHRLKYVEFDVARRVFFQRFRRIVDSELTVLSFEERMAAATTLDECWAVIIQAADEFGFAHVRLGIGSARYEETLRPIDPVACWSFQIPLSESDYIEFKRAVRAEFPASAAVPFFDLAHMSLRASLARFQGQPRNRKEPIFASAGRE